MVNTDIPKHYTASPSSFSGTPHLTINREVADDLDSTNVFEGLFYLPYPYSLADLGIQDQKSY